MNLESLEGATKFETVGVFWIKGTSWLGARKIDFFFIYYFDSKFAAEYDAFHRISKFDFVNKNNNKEI